MTEQQYNLFLTGGALVCALGCLLNLARLKSRGTSAMLLSAAFLATGGLLLLLKLKANQILIGCATVLIVALLVGDVLVKSKTYGQPEDKR